MGHLHGHRHGHDHGFGPGAWFGRGHGRPHDREAWLERLEEHRKDLEQRLADVSDLINRLKQEPKETASV